MALDIKDDWPLLAGGLLVVFAVMYALRSSGSSSSNPTVSYQTVGADPAITAEETSMYAAKQQTVQSIFSGLFGLKAVQANDATSEANVATEANAATYEAGLAETAALGEASYSTEANIIGANDQLSAAQAQAHASQQNGFWGSLFGAVTGVAKDVTGVGALVPTSSDAGVPGVGSFGSYE